MEKGHIFPGDLVVGADSHTCTYGALNAFATGVGSTDLAAVWISGRLWFRVPETIKILLQGGLPFGVFAKDLILYLVGKLTAEGANYRAVEFAGSTMDSLNIEGRFTITNMVVEMGAKAGIMPADAKTFEWLKTVIDRPFSPVEADPDAVYEKVLEFDVSRLEPQVARPHTVDNVCVVGELTGTPIQQAFLGTCTNGRIEDLRIAAKILRGKKVSSEVRFIVAPASRNILRQAIQEGIISSLIDAGAAVVTPGCGPCVGTHNGIPADGENVISSANRNFKGRMGNNRAFIYLASPATVTASALTGEITDPRQII
jgi:3-isopropylmalate/(R)-2-methylmalate dehydratase large subunit